MTGRIKTMLFKQLKQVLPILIMGAAGVILVPDALAQSWSSGAPMPVRRFDLGVVGALDGRIFAFGGNYTGDYRPVNHAEAYDPATDIWVAVRPTQIPRMGPAVARGPNGLIYLFGGLDRNQNAINTVEAYNPVTDTWTTKTAMLTARGYAAAVTGSDGLIYVIGGELSPRAEVNVVEAYNPMNDTWTIKTPMPTARYVLAAVRRPADDLIYAIGGANTDSQTLNTVEIYNPATGVWSSGLPLNTGRFSPAATVGADGRIYVIGGFNNGSLASVEVFDGVAWSAGLPMPTARYDLSAATGADGRIYAIGGYDDNTPVLGTVEIYTP